MSKGHLQSRNCKDFLDCEKNEGETTIINIRKLAALDIVLHGPRFILAECVLGVGLCGIFGFFSFFIFSRSTNHPLFTLIMGCILSWIALNYVPLLLYAISIIKRKSAKQEVAFELEHKEIYGRKYTIQSALLLLPLIVPILAITQEVQKRSGRDQ